jgi:hypothetical protein
MAENKYQRIQNANKQSAEKPKSVVFKKSGFAKVLNIILEDSENISSAEIGSVEFKSESSQVGNAYPIDRNFLTLPIKNEVVELYQKIVNGAEVGGIYYRRIGLSPTPNFSNAINEIQAAHGNLETNSSDSKDSYGETRSTGTTSTNNNNQDATIGYGNYFQPQRNIHKLKLYEGDTLIETRFGQSIRFSAYNNGSGNDRKFAPTTIIRNGENEKSKKEKYGISTEENLKEDGSIIAMTSSDYEIEFSGGSEFSKIETKPDSFKDYPSKLKDDQILINSGRLILSSKTAEMIFYSKKNYGFISDGQMSIDNKFGLFAKLGGEFNLKTNNQKISLLGGSGKIYLNTEKETEPIARAATLVNILRDLINEIKKQQYLTPSGPTKIGPENVPAFDTILSKLDTIKSTLNFTE